VAAAFVQPPDTIVIYETDGNGVPNELYHAAQFYLRALPGLGPIRAPPQAARCAMLRGIVAGVPHHGRHVPQHLRDVDIAPAPRIHAAGPTTTVSGPLHKRKFPAQSDSFLKCRGRNRYVQKKAQICHTWGLEKDRLIGYLLCDALHLLAFYLMMNLEKELFIV
jgi:hypothetical protein